MATVSEVFKKFKDDFGITLTEDQAKDYIAFTEKKNSEELSDDAVEAVAGGASLEEEEEPAQG